MSVHRYPMRGRLPAPLHGVGDYGNCGRFQRVVVSLDERRGEKQTRDHRLSPSIID